MSLFDDEDFNLEASDLAEDTNLSVVDEAKIKTLETMEKVIKSLKENIEFNEKNDAFSNLQILSRHLSNLTDIFGLDNKRVSEEELLDEIEKIYKQTTELTLENIEAVLKDDEESTDIETSDDDDDGDIDF